MFGFLAIFDDKFYDFAAYLFTILQLMLPFLSLMRTNWNFIKSESPIWFHPLPASFQLGSCYVKLG